jgi:hypothetical protein
MVKDILIIMGILFFILIEGIIHAMAILFLLGF